LGYEIVGTTDTGEEAIEIARKMRPSLVLMDIRLADDGPRCVVVAHEHITEHKRAE
jgi:DNA-binding NarL/FixJ family response regulator